MLCDVAAGELDLNSCDRRAIEDHRVVLLSASQPVLPGRSCIFGDSFQLFASNNRRPWPFPRLILDGAADQGDGAVGDQQVEMGRRGRRVPGRWGSKRRGY